MNSLRAAPTWLRSADDPYELLTDIVEVRSRLRSGARHYVYILHRPNGEPFYVGKGVAERVLHHEAEARNSRRLTHKLNVIRAIRAKGDSIGYWLDSFYDLEADALARERELIALIGRHDLSKGPLTNQTDGGEGQSNPSEESRQRRRESLWGDSPEDNERGIANRFFQQIARVRSVPIKPAATFKAAGLWANDDRIGMSARQAAALAASAIQNRVLLTADAAIPRRLSVEGIEYVIENGVGRDMISSGMIRRADGPPAHELMLLSEVGFDYLVQSVGRNVLESAGVLEPET